MAKYKPLDRGKYQSSFDQMFGEGRYEQGMQSARDTGRLKVEASLARKAFEQQQKEREKRRKEEQKAREKAKATEHPKAAEGRKKPESKSGDGVLDKLVSGAKGFVDGVNRAQARAIDTLTMNHFSNKSKEAERETGKPKYDYFDERQGVGKAIDVVSDMSGYLLGGIGATTGLRALGATGKGVQSLSAAHKAGTTTGKILAKGAASAAGEGALIGGGFAGLESLNRLAYGNSEGVRDELGNVVKGTILGGAIDPIMTVGMPALKYASRSAVDNAIVNQGAEALGQAVRRADISPQAISDSSILQTLQNSPSTSQGSERALRLLADGQVNAKRTSDMFQINNPQATAARNVMQDISQNAGRKPRGVDAEENLMELIANSRQKGLASETNRAAATPTNPKLDASDSLQEVATTRASSPLDELVPNREPVRPAQPLQEFTEAELAGTAVGRNVKKSKPTMKDRMTELQRQTTNDLAPVRRWEDEVAKFDKDGVIERLRPETTIGKVGEKFGLDPNTRLTGGVPQKPVESSFEKSLLIMNNSKSVASKETLEAYKPLLQKVNSTKTVTPEMLGDYAADKRIMELGNQFANTKAELDTLRFDYDDVVAKVGKESAEAVELSKAIKELEGKVNYTYTAGQSPELSAERVASYENNPELVEMYKEFQSTQRANIKRAYENGIITEDSYKAMLKNEDYSSMARIFDDQNLSGTSKYTVNSPIGNLKGGSEEAIKDPIISAMLNRYKTELAIQKNNTLLPVFERYAKIDAGDIGVRPVKSEGVNTVRLFKNGKEVYFDVDPVLKNYIDNLNADLDPNVFAKTIQNLADLQRKLTTQYSVAFQAKSLLRETPQAIFTSRTAKNELDAIKNFTLGFLDAVFGENLEKFGIKSFKNTYESLGGTGYQFIRTSDDDMQRVAKQLLESGTTKSKIKKLNPYNLIGKLGENVEKGLRLGEFRSAMNQGYSVKDALYEAADITNYKRRGTMIDKLNPYTPFLNATIQGNARVINAVNEAPVKSIMRGATMMSSTALAAYGLRQYANENQQSELDNLSQWEKDAYLHVVVPNSDTILALPKSFAVGQLFMNPVERSLDDYYNTTLGEKDVADHVREGFSSTLKSFAPPVEMAGISTAIDLMANKNVFFNGLDIESQYDIDNNVPKGERESYSQSAVTKVLADYINAVGQFTAGKEIVSPAQVDYALKDILGSVGTDALEMADHALKDSVPSDPIMSQLLKPVNQFVQDPTRSSGVYAELKKLAADEKRNNNSMAKMTEAEKNVERANRPIQNYETAFKEINKQIQEVRSSLERTSQEKKELITELRKQQDSLGTQAIDWYNSIGK